MNTLDIVILIIIGLGILRGLFTGAVRQIATVVGLIAAFLVGTWFMYPIGETITSIFNISDRYAGIIGFILVFISVAILVQIAAYLLESLFSLLRLTPLNRVAGGILGGFKAVFLLSIALFVLAYVDVPVESSRTESLLYAPVASVLPEVWQIVTERAPEAIMLVNRVDVRSESE